MQFSNGLRRLFLFLKLRRTIRILYLISRSVPDTDDVDVVSRASQSEETNEIEVAILLISVSRICLVIEKHRMMLSS